MRSITISLRLTLSLSCILHSYIAMASKARVDSLGGENITHHYMQDGRHILLNPATLNLNRDFITFEWGKDKEGAATTESGPKPEGGLFKAIGPFVYGLYVGADEGHENRDEILLLTNNNSGILYQDNPVELFIAGDAGTQWGFSAKYSKNIQDQTGIPKSQQSFTSKFGLLSGPFDLRVVLNLLDKSHGGLTPREELRGKTGLLIEGSYSLKEVTLYVEGQVSGYDYYRASDGLKDIEKKSTQFKWGGGQVIQINEQAKLLFDIHATHLSSIRKKNMVSFPISEKEKSLTLPLTLGLEMLAKDWLTLRASLSQNLYSLEKNANQQRKTARLSTVVSSGATIDFGQMKLDGLLGTTGTTGNNEKSGVLSLSNLLTQVSLTYAF